MSACMDCGKNLTYNEIGAYKKFVNRGSRSFLCKQCLAQKLDVTTEDIDRKIEQFKTAGLHAFCMKGGRPCLFMFRIALRRCSETRKKMKI